MPASLAPRRHLIYANGLEALQEFPGFLEIKFGIPRFDAEKKSLAGSQLEALDVKDGMVRRGQAVERQHPENRDACGRQYSHFERNGNKGRPAVLGFAPDD